MNVVLIGCVAGKQDRPAAAQDLYVSPLFRRRRAYAERSGAAWAILSALHGVVLPEHELAPYEWTITDWRISEIEGWGHRTAVGYHSVAWLAAGGDYERQREALAGCVVEIHAGRKYVEPLRPHLVAAGAEVVTPLAGLAIGEQLAWYGAAAARS